MDTSNFEIQQGAVNPVDLPQLKPHEEVKVQATSAVSSDEEKLAAGISTIGLQTKRLSAAQRRKLMKAKKMREGTWTEKKPPRKTPPPQDKGAEGSAAGVKRPHSDSSTPSSAKQQPKKSRSTQVQTGTYKEAVSGIRMAIIHGRHPEIKLDQAQVEKIQDKLMNAMEETFVEETSPQFLHSRFAQGVLWITCANDYSKDWLTRTTSKLGELWEGAELKAVDAKDLPKRPRVLVRVPDTTEVTSVMTRLGAQNRELNTMEWLVMSRKVTEREQTLALSIDPDSYTALARLNFKAFWGLGRIIFRTLKDGKGEPKDEDNTNKSASQ